VAEALAGMFGFADDPPAFIVGEYVDAGLVWWTVTVTDPSA
jgi:hypothetical protein